MAAGVVGRALWYTLVVSWFGASTGYNMFHAVDVMSVVCDAIPVPDPLPDGMAYADWPVEKEWNVYINFDNDMDESKPHVVTFIRPSTGSLDITYEVTDGTGLVAVPTTTTSLDAESTLIAANAACMCTGANTGADLSGAKPADYGKSCSAWDKVNCATWFPGATLGHFCCQDWCYVPKSCPGAYNSELATSLYFSYDGACGGTSLSAAAPTCSYDTLTSAGSCACISVAATPEFTTLNATDFGATYGSSCREWDFDWCPEMYPAWVLDTWCCASWCWVDQASCGDQAIASEVWPGLYWSLDMCASATDDKKVAQCPYKRSATAPPSTASSTAGAAASPTPAPVACTCSGSQPPLLSSGRRRSGVAFGSSYGTFCDAWDKANCPAFFPNEAIGIWCCQSWCYVDEACATANPSMLYSGYSWSYAACPDDGEELAECAHSTDCAPKGNSMLSTAQKTQLGATYGGDGVSLTSSCAAWDQAACTTTWSSNKRWTDEANKNWCCDTWTYVDAKCPMAQESDMVANAFYAYGVCDGTAAAAAAAATSIFDTVDSTCKFARRLEDSGNASDELMDTPLRRLAARRRSASSSSARRRTSSSGYSAPRRRASTPRRRAPAPSRTSSSPRRRAPPSRRRSSAALYTAPRRRVSYEQPRRRAASAPRRRANPPAPPPPAASAVPARRRMPAVAPSPARRRVPVNQAPVLPEGSPRRRTERRRAPAIGVDSSARRRAAAMAGSGQSLDHGPRRRAGLSDQRRRTASYGYSNVAQQHNSYGGSVPQQTKYGYSGPGPKKNSNVPVMMAAGAGLAGGVMLGAGAYYMYNRYSEKDASGANEWGSNNLQDQSWCSDPNTGKMMTCNDCGKTHGASNCKDLNDCYGKAGCQYKMPEATRRDEIMESGFIPMEFTQPLKVTVSKIVGADYLKANICPVPLPATGTAASNWIRASEFDTTFFVTLTEMDSFAGPNIAASSGDAISASLPLLLTVIVASIMRSFFFRPSR